MASGSDGERMEETIKLFLKCCSPSDEETEFVTCNDGWIDSPADSGEDGSIDSGEDRSIDSGGDADDEADEHHPPPLKGGDRVYHPEDDRTGTLRFPHSSHDESYLVLECEDYSDEEPVKSKPQKGSLHSQPSSSDTDTTDSNKAGRAKPKKKSSSTAKADRPQSDYGGNDNTECISEATNAIATDQPVINNIMMRRVIAKIPHGTFCKGVSRGQKSPKEFPINGRLTFSKYGVRVHCLKLHYRGLDQDYDRRFATLEAVVHFSPNSRALLGAYDCGITFVVDVYRDEVHPSKRIGTEMATATRTITSDERTQNSIDIVVNRVVNLDEIVYPDVSPEAIVLRITATLETRMIQVNPVTLALRHLSKLTRVSKIQLLGS